MNEYEEQSSRKTMLSGVESKGWWEGGTVVLQLPPSKCKRKGYWLLMEEPMSIERIERHRKSLPEHYLEYCSQNVYFHKQSKSELVAQKIHIPRFAWAGAVQTGSIGFWLKSFRIWNSTESQKLSKNCSKTVWSTGPGSSGLTSRQLLRGGR